MGSYPLLIFDILRLLLRGRALVVLLLLLLFVGPSMIMTRHITGALDQDPPLFLRYAPEIPALSGYTTFLHWKAFPTISPPQMAAFYHSGELLEGSSLGLNGLDEIYRVLIALVMLPIGANILPQNRAIFGSLFSVPIRKPTLFLLHACALGMLLVVVFAATFAVNAAAVAGIGSATPENLRLLFNNHVLLLLYGSVFGFLGLGLAAIFRVRGVALLAGLAAIVLVVAILPNLQSGLYNAYRTSHELEIRLAGLRGEAPNDALYRAIQALSLAPASAYTYSMLYMRYDMLFPASSLCHVCKPGEMRWGWIRRARLTLALTSVGLVIVGTTAFRRKQVLT